VKMLDSIDNCL